MLVSFRCDHPSTHLSFFVRKKRTVIFLFFVCEFSGQIRTNLCVFKCLIISFHFIDKQGRVTRLKFYWNNCFKLFTTAPPPANVCKKWTFWRSFKGSVPLSLESKVSAFQWTDEADSPGEIRRWSLDSKWVVPQEKASKGLSSVHCNSHTSWYHTKSKSRLKKPTQEGRGTPRTYSKISDAEIMFFLLCFSNRKNPHDSKAEV